MNYRSRGGDVQTFATPVRTSHARIGRPYCYHRNTKWNVRLFMIIHGLPKSRQFFFLQLRIKYSVHQKCQKIFVTSIVHSMHHFSYTIAGITVWQTLFLITIQETSSNSHLVLIIYSRYITRTESADARFYRLQILRYDQGKRGDYLVDLIITYFLIFS